MTEQQKQDISVYDISLKPDNLDDNKENNLILSCKINYNNQEIPITIQFNTKNNPSEKHVIDLYDIKFTIGNNSYKLQRDYTDSSKCLKITLLSLMGYYTSENYYQLFQQNDLTKYEEALRKKCFLRNFPYRERVLTLKTFLKSCLSEISEKNDTIITNLLNLFCLKSCLSKISEKNDTTITDLSDFLQQDENIHVPDIDTKNIDILSAPDFNTALQSFKQAHQDEHNQQDNKDNNNEAKSSNNTANNLTTQHIKNSQSSRCGWFCDIICCNNTQSEVDKNSNIIINDGAQPIN